MEKIYQIGVGGCLVSFLVYHQWPIFSFFVSCILYVCVATFGLLLGIILAVWKGKIYVPQTEEKHVSPITTVLLQNAQLKLERVLPQQKVVLSRNLDLAFKEVLDLAIKDYVLSWYKDLVPDEKGFVNHLRHDFWIVLEKFSSQLEKINWVQFMSHDMINTLCKHYQAVEMAAEKSKPGESQKPFALHHFLESEEKETEYLRKVADFVLVRTLSSEYSKCVPVRHLIREILTCKVLKPTIETICDPDYINQTILGYVEYRLRLAEEHRRTYTYAASYEQFYKMILECEDIEHLKQMRLSIITEIMQATTINNIKKAEGVDEDKETVPKRISKGDLLKARNLRRYINQLSLAKTKCEQRIRLLGGAEYSSYGDADENEKEYNIPGKKVLSFVVIMDSPEGRKYFQKFLQKDENDSLIRFWAAIEQLRVVDRSQRHQIASEIYQMFIASSSSVIKLERACVKDMEAFMLGDKGPEAFYEAQRQVKGILEKQYYPSFLVSDVYHTYVSNLELEELNHQDNGRRRYRKSTGGSDDSYEDINISEIEGYENPNYVISRHSTYAQQKLTQLDEKIMNKTQALQALKASQKAGDEKIQKVHKDIDDEIERLKFERRHLEFHIERTEVWSENIGKWQTKICNSEVTQEDGKLITHFVILVHLSGSALHQPEKSGTHGWVLSRSLGDFHALHSKLCLFASWLRKKELPTISKFSFKSVDSAFLEKSKNTLEHYLQTVLKDERMSQSEALYAFLSPSPEYLKQTSEQGDRKKTFSLKNFFKSLPGGQEQKSEEELLFFDEESKEDTTRDDIAEPLYTLIGQVFHLKGVTKLLRRTLVVFVQVTFGRSINRQVRDIVEWIFSESMLIWYIHLFRDSLWPNGKLAPTAPSRSDEEKVNTRIQAKEDLLEFIPDAVKNLLGEKNTRHGAIRLFETLQDKRLNKQLFYCMLELLLQETYPILRVKPTDPSDTDEELQTSIAIEAIERHEETVFNEDTEKKKHLETLALNLKNL